MESNDTCLWDETSIDTDTTEHLIAFVNGKMSVDLKRLLLLMGNKEHESFV